MMPTLDISMSYPVSSLYGRHPCQPVGNTYEVVGSDAILGKNRFLIELTFILISPDFYYLHSG